MEFRVLGSLEVLSDGVVVPIAGRLHPRILAGLLLNAGRTVSVEWLVDLLWDDNPPATATRQVQNAVATLRRRLEPVRPGLIERIGREYRVNIADDQLDLRRFEGLSREARRAAEAGRWAEAFEGFGAALGLWRGSALGGMPGRVLLAAAARLDDKRLSVFEEYAEAALAVDRAKVVVGDLRGLAVVHPLRQRLHGRLMQALHQLGNSSEALQIFKKLQKQLAEELGLDPDNQLKLLNVEILQGQPSLLAVKDPIVADIGREWKRPIPAELPSDVASFTGRTKQLVALDRLRDSGATASVVSAITGIGGVGKTALAVHWGHSRREDFPDGQLYINLRGFDDREPLTPHEGVSRLLRSLGHPVNDIPADLEKASCLYQSLLSDRRMFIVLDNARTADQVKPMLPSTPGSFALITSRNRLSELAIEQDVEPVDLPSFNTTESLELLTQLVGAEAASDIEISRKLAKLCGHLPLALRIVAANRTNDPHKSLEQFVTELDGASRLPRLNVDNDAATNISAVFNLSYNKLSKEAQRIYTYLGLIPGDDFTVDLVAHTTGVPTNFAQTILNEIERSYFVEQYQDYRFRLHDLVRLHARDMAMTQLSPPNRQSAEEKIADWYGSTSSSRAHEFDNFVTTFDSLSKYQRKLVRMFGTFASEGGDINRAIACVKKTLLQAHDDNDIKTKVSALATLAALHDLAGQKTTSVSLGRQAVRLLSQIEDASLKELALGNLGTILSNNDNPVEAEEYLKQALKIAKDTNYKRGIQLRTSTLGVNYRIQGRYNDAKTYLREALQIAESENQSHQLSTALASLAYTHSIVGENLAATEAAQRAYNIASKIGSTRAMALAKTYLGHIFRNTFQYSHAIESYEVALEIARQDHRLRMYVAVLEDIADTHVDMGNHVEARKRLDSAILIEQTVSSRRGASAEHERILCRIFTTSRDHQLAIKHGTEACHLNRTTQNIPLFLARSLDALALAHQGAGNHAEAREAWTEALAIFTRLGTPEAAAVADRLREAPDTP